MFGSINKFKSIPQLLCLLWGKSLIQRSRPVRIEVVHHQCDFPGILVTICNFRNKMRPVLLGFSFCNLDHSPPCQGLIGHKNITEAMTLILIIVSNRPTRCTGNRGLHLAYQLTRRFIHANHRKPAVVRPPVDIQHHFHMRYERGVFCRRDDPASLFPRLEFVFFNTRRTVSYDTLSTYCNSTSLSANNRNDHLACPGGGSLQLSATKCASKSPSAFRSYTRWPLRPFSATSSPSSTNRCFTRYIFIALTCNISAMSCSLIVRAFGPFSSQFKSINPTTQLDYRDPVL